jgi:DNA-binding NarL/FixJ family response regulator
MIRTLVAAAFPTVRAGLAAVLRADSSIEIVGDAANGETLLSLAASLQPDVVLVDLETAADDLATAVMRLAEQSGATGLVLLCDAPNGWIQDALRAGVRAIIARDSAAAEIAAAVHGAGLGLMVLNAVIVQSLLPVEQPSRLAAAGESGEALTPREIEVLRHVSEGLGNKTISRRLGISEHTVKFHVGAIMSKLNAASRTEAVTIAARRGLILL